MANDSRAESKRLPIHSREGDRVFFYVDESGNTGNNLFDKQQPVLSYGVLSSRWDVDEHATAERDAILRTIAAPSLHANQLSHTQLRDISGALLELHSQYEFHFDYYFIDKPSFAVVTFFNAVFDAGLNDAMKRDWYWTPLRFPLIYAIDSILDEDLRRESWQLCLVPREKVAGESTRIVSLLEAVLSRVEAAHIDARMKEILSDALRFGIKSPGAMDFGIYSPTALSPNTICFQFVLTAIALRQKVHREKALRITVDRQTQFNPAQLRTYEIQSKIAASLRGDNEGRSRYLAHPFLEGAREDTAALVSHFPEEKVTITQSSQSFGLQLTDTYLWLMNRLMQDRDIPEPLIEMLDAVIGRDMMDGISVDAMMRRWDAFERQLPAFSDVTPEQQRATQQIIDAHREKVKHLGVL